MRFWQKIFLCSLALIMVTISIVSLLLLKANHQGNIEQARQNGISSHDLVIGSMQTAVVHDRYQAGNAFLDEEEMIKSISRLADSYNRPVFLTDNQSGQSAVVYFELYKDHEQMFSNLPFEPRYFSKSSTEIEAVDNVDTNQQSLEGSERPAALIDRPELELSQPLERYTIIQSLDKGHWLFVSSLIELENRTYTLVTIKDVSDIYTLLYNQIYFSADLMLGLALAAAGVLLIIAIWLTRPIAILRQYTSRFSKGEYNIRLAVGGRDELSALGHDFNSMAEAVENNIHSLEQMNEDRTRFIDNLTHEIKSPLTSIIGFADLIRQAPSMSDEERIRQAEYIYKEGRHLEHISKLLMDLTLLGSDQFDLEQVDIFDLLEEISFITKPIMEKYHVELTLNNQHGIVAVNLELFRSLLSNILENAAKASKEGEKVFLIAKLLDSHQIEVAIKDNGCGIPEKEIEKIRQPFYVLDKARTRKAGGAGLGLALCDEIARVHNAELKIESKIDAGTTVRLVFPLVEKPAPEIAALAQLSEVNQTAKTNSQNETTKNIASQEGQKASDQA